MGSIDDAVTGADGEEVNRVRMPVTRIVDAPAEVRTIDPDLSGPDPPRGDDVSDVPGVSVMPVGALDAPSDVAVNEIDDRESGLRARGRIKEAINLLEPFATLTETVFEGLKNDAMIALALLLFARA